MVDNFFLVFLFCRFFYCYLLVVHNFFFYCVDHSVDFCFADDVLVDFDFILVHHVEVDSIIDAEFYNVLVVDEVVFVVFYNKFEVVQDRFVFYHEVMFFVCNFCVYYLCEFRFCYFYVFFYFVLVMVFDHFLVYFYTVMVITVIIEIHHSNVSIMDLLHF